MSVIRASEQGARNADAVREQEDYPGRDQNAKGTGGPVHVRGANAEGAAGEGEGRAGPVDGGGKGEETAADLEGTGGKEDNPREGA